MRYFIGLIFLALHGFTWNPEAGLYEWTRTGSITGIDGKMIGEASISRFDDSWIVAARCYKTGAATAWYRTDDLFAGLGEPVIIEKDRRWQCPRHSYKCADGKLRIFLNNRDWSCKARCRRQSQFFVLWAVPRGRVCSGYKGLMEWLAIQNWSTTTVGKL